MQPFSILADFDGVRPKSNHRYWLNTNSPREEREREREREREQRQNLNEGEEAAAAPLRNL